MAYTLLEVDRTRLTGTPGTPITPSEAASVKRTSHDLGRLRRRLDPEGGSWIDEVTEELRPRIDDLANSFTQHIERLVSRDNIKDEATVVKLKEIAAEIAELQDDGGVWLGTTIQRLNEIGPGPG
jgi:hypothetical protein